MNCQIKTILSQKLAVNFLISYVFFWSNWFFDLIKKIGLFRIFHLFLAFLKFWSTDFFKNHQKDSKFYKILIPQNIKAKSHLWRQFIRFRFSRSLLARLRISKLNNLLFKFRIERQQLSKTVLNSISIHRQIVYIIILHQQFTVVHVILIVITHQFGLLETHFLFFTFHVLVLRLWRRLAILDDGIGGVGVA